MTPSKLFVYGILKRNLALDLSKFGGVYLGDAALPNTQLYHIGSGVGMRHEQDGTSHGEVWEIPEGLWAWLDRIEQNGFCYTREIVETLYGPTWTYFHTFPGMQYTTPIKGGKFNERSE